MNNAPREDSQTANILRLAQQGLAQKQISEELRADYHYVGTVLWKLRQRGLLAAPPKGWSDDMLETLRVLIVDEKQTGSQAAAALAAKFGRPFTRNMVVGMAARNGWRSGLNAHEARFGLKPRPIVKSPTRIKATPVASCSAPAPVPAPRLAVKPATPLCVVAPIDDWSPRRITLLELGAGLCRFPIGDPRSDSFAFCGAPTAPEKTYCPHCAGIAYDSPADRAAVRKAWREARGLPA